MSLTDNIVRWGFYSRMIAEGKVSEEDIEFFSLVDTVDEAVEVIDDFYSKYSIQPNF